MERVTIEQGGDGDGEHVDQRGDEEALRQSRPVIAFTPGAQ